MIFVVILLTACIHVWQRVVVIGLVKDVSALQKESHRYVDEVHKVHSEIASLSMAARIESYAADSLGLQRATPDRIYTLVPKVSDGATADQFATMLSSIRRVADYLPVLNQAQAETQELQPIKFESSSCAEEEQ